MKKYTASRTFLLIAKLISSKNEEIRDNEGSWKRKLNRLDVCSCIEYITEKK